MQRNTHACDRCHELRLKCVKSIQGCGRCTRLQIPCRYERTILKPGRRLSRHPSTPNSDAAQVVYPVLNCLAAFGVLSKEQAHYTTQGEYLCSDIQASRLLDHYYSSPNQEFQVRIIRKSNLLSFENPRITSPGLLFSILCISCYMPTRTGSPVVTSFNHGELVRLRRSFLSQCLKLLQPVFLSETDPTFDDAVTLSTLGSIGSSEDETHQYLPQWIAFLKFVVRQMNLFIEPDRFDEEYKEEHRRLWWTTWIADRHSALSFNLRPQLTELECKQLLRPCADTLWESTEPLSLLLANENAQRSKGVDYEVYYLDFFGVFVPLAAILGDILEYHFLRQHAAFGSNTVVLDYICQTIERNLETWSLSLQQRLQELKGSRTDMDNNFEESYDGQVNHNVIIYQPKYAIYGRHLFHCMHILLYGKMDFVHMYQDTDWLSSPNFLRAAEHASHCAKITACILDVDPKLHLCYRFFGTYLLQSSFVFLILAQKLGNTADNYIIDNCRIHLRALDAFVGTVNISYQRTFARILRGTLSRCVGAAVDTYPSSSGQELRAEENFDPGLLKYRWTAGYSGLWNEDLGRPKEAKMRRFPRPS